MSNIDPIMAEEMQGSWKHGQTFQPCSTSFFIVFGKERMAKNESVMLLSQNDKNEWLKGASTCTYRI